MDEFTKRIVRRAMRDNPGLHVRDAIVAVRWKQSALKGTRWVPNRLLKER